MSSDGCSHEDVVQWVIEVRNVLRDNRAEPPYKVRLPGRFEKMLDEPYKSGGDDFTLLRRLNAINEIEVLSPAQVL